MWAPFAANLLNAVLHFWICQVRKPRHLVQTYLDLAYVYEQLVDVSPYWQSKHGIWQHTLTSSPHHKKANASIVLTFQAARGAGWTWHLCMWWLDVQKLQCFLIGSLHRINWMLMCFHHDINCCLCHLSTHLTSESASGCTSFTDWAAHTLLLFMA